MVLAMTAGLVSQAVSQTTQRANRITQELSGGPNVRIPGTVHPLTRRATDLGTVDSNLPLDSLTLNIGLSAAEQTELDALTEAQQDPKSPQYHQWLTQEQFGARFGLTDADLGKVTGWLAGQGFTVKSVAPSRNLITFSGTVSQVETTFRTQIHQYRLADGTTHISNATEIAIPSGLFGVVTHVGGLNDFRPKPRAIIKRKSPQFTSSISGDHFLSPLDWVTIYNVGAIYTAGQTGSGMHIGIIGQTYFPTTDIDKFRAAAGLGTKNLTMFCITRAVCTSLTDESVGDMGEADLDVEWAGGIADNATVDYIYTSAADPTQGAFEALYYAITTYKAGGSVVPVLSMSYGNCEKDLGSGYTTSVDHFFQQAASQGQTILNSSGDAGAAGCDQGSTISTQGTVADWPASSPYVTGVGGTTFNGDGSDTGGDAYWNPAISGDLINSARKYIPETSWNDTAAEQALNATSKLASSGGGVSEFYSLPTWQWSPSNYAGTAMRFVPDVAFAASPEHDGYLVCTQDFPTGATSPSQTLGSSCVNGFRYSDNSLFVYGGTSAGAPSFGGMMTLLVQKYGSLGNINSKLYSLASNATTYATVFHDITTGNDKQPCSKGTGCSGGFVGYSATTGYDLVTGLGSINGFGLYSAWGSTSTLAATATTVTASPSSLTIGGTTTLTASVASTTGTITGTVTIKVGNTILGTPVVSGGIATLSNVTVSAANGFSAGVDSITASYGGDSNFAASSGSTTLAVVGLPTTTTVSALPNSLSIGETTTLSAPVTSASAGTIAGSVTFEVGGTSIGTASVSSGTATLSNVPVSAANGFGVGSDTITASYSGDATFGASSGTTTLTVAALPSFTFTGTAPATIAAGSGTAVTLNVTSINYAGTVLFATSVTLNGAPSNAVSASATPVSLTSGGTGTSTLTITTSASAEKRAPAVPWTSGGGVVFCVVLLGAPFTVRRKGAIAVLLTALTILLAGFLMSCGGGGGSSATTKAPRVYTVLVTATGSGTVTNPPAATVMVTVP
jgi:hypothetical protein